MPNGCGLGATWSKQTIHAAGKVLGTEARGLHNMFLDEQGNRGGSCNGQSRLDLASPMLF